ncbi:MAG: hypothetical protein ACTSR8_16860 [Promethearchaeota archaeon]
MKETTKYNNYRFVGKINVDEIEPWFDFDKAKPWDEMEVPWLMENKVRREILIILAEGAKSFDEIFNHLNFAPKPLLIAEEDYKTSIKFQWDKKTLKNHLLNLEWYDLVKKNGNTYEITIPILKMEKVNEIDEYITTIADKWTAVIKDIKEEAKSKFSSIEHKKAPIFGVLIEKTVEKLYGLLKKENLLPDIPNIKTLWAEQLRAIKFEQWIAQNF